MTRYHQAHRRFRLLRINMLEKTDSKTTH